MQSEIENGRKLTWRGKTVGYVINADFEYGRVVIGQPSKHRLYGQWIPLKSNDTSAFFTYVREKGLTEVELEGATCWIASAPDDVIELHFVDEPIRLPWEQALDDSPSE